MRRPREPQRRLAEKVVDSSVRARVDWVGTEAEAQWRRWLPSMGMDVSDSDRSLLLVEDIMVMIIMVRYLS